MPCKGLMPRLLEVVSQAARATTVSGKVPLHGDTALMYSTDATLHAMSKHVHPAAMSLLELSARLPWHRMPFRATAIAMRAASMESARRENSTKGRIGTRKPVHRPNSSLPGI